MSVIDLQKDEKRVIRQKAKQLVDTDHQYLHVIITSKMDDCSVAEI